MSLDGVSHPYISVGIDRFGGMVGGGIAFNLSDMLGNQNLYAQISADKYGGGAESSSKNTGVLIGVRTCRSGGTGVCRRAVAVHRWRICSGGASSTASPCFSIRRSSSGRSIAASAECSPIHSARPRDRVWRRIHRDLVRGADSDDCDLSAHRPLSTNDGDESAADPLNLSSVSTALVTDSSLFGPTSPVAGGRSRLEVRRPSAICTDDGAGRLPALLHAGAVLHHRRPRPALRALRRGWPRTTG